MHCHAECPAFHLVFSRFFRGTAGSAFRFARRAMISSAILISSSVRLRETPIVFAVSQTVGYGVSTMTGFLIPSLYHFE